MAQLITLEEAAEKLGLTPDEMKKRLKTDPDFKRLSQIRDGSTVRFKQSAIEELARELGMSSEDNLPLAPITPEGDEPGSDDFKVPGAGGKKPKKGDDEVPLDFGSSEDDVFSLADEPKPASPKSSAKLTPNKPPKSSPDTGSTDSDVRLDAGKKKKGDEAAVPTEEIALDFSGPGSAVIKGGSSAKLSAPKSSGKLSAPDSGKVKAAGDSGKLSKKSDANMGKKPGAAKKSDLSRAAPPADSSEFELSLDADSDDFELQMSGDSSGDEVDLGTLPKGGSSTARGSKSGINLRDPADSGISLEKGKGKDTGKTAKPAGAKDNTTKGAMSDSSGDVNPEPSSDVDFELSLDSSSAASASKLGAPKSGKLVLDSESDSEFELTLDDSSSSSLEQAALGADALDESADKGDIFETDFEIPPMPDESGSEAVAVEPDSDLEKSDFELAMDDSDVAADDPSGSAVVLVEDEEGAPRAKKGKAKGKKDATEEDEVDLGADGVEVGDESEVSVARALKGVKGKKRDADEEDEEEEEMAPAGAVVERPTKPWGVLPALCLAPTLLIVMVGALMGYELLQTMWGYQQPRKPAAPIVRGVADTFGMPLND